MLTGCTVTGRPGTPMALCQSAAGPCPRRGSKMRTCGAHVVDFSRCVSWQVGSLVASHPDFVGAKGGGACAHTHGTLMVHSTRFFGLL